MYFLQHLEIWFTLNNFSSIIFCKTIKYKLFLRSRIIPYEVDFDAFRNLVIRTSNDPDYYSLAGPLFIITCIFSIITGGLICCHEIRRRFLELPPFEPQWLQALLRPCDWDLTRGKPRAASYKGMEGQDKIEADGFDAFMGEGQGDAQNNDRGLGTYIPRNLFLHIFQAYIIYIFIINILIYCISNYYLYYYNLYI